MESEGYIVLLMNQIKDLVSQLIGSRCSKVILEDLNPLDMECNKLLLSKALSFGILLGGLFVKVPQILKVLMSGSSKGLSLPSLLIETSASLISVAYNLRKQHPFTTFGESLFIMIQNALLVALILGLRYPSSRKEKSKSDNQDSHPSVGSKDHADIGSSSVTRTPSVWGIFVVFFWIGIFLTSTYVLIRVPDTDTLAMFQSWSIGLIIAARVPQIMLNMMNKSTGKLSFLTTFLMAGGSLARVFTIWQEVSDYQLFLSVSIAATLNIILLLQFFLYWKTPNSRPHSSISIPNTSTHSRSHSVASKKD
jgi:mannose-P-dolichol utilization defect protein 1